MNHNWEDTIQEHKEHRSAFELEEVNLLIYNILIHTSTYLYHFIISVANSGYLTREKCPALKRIQHKWKITAPVM